MVKGVKQISKFIIRIGVSLLLFAWLLSRTDKGELLAAIRAMSLKSYMAALLMYLTSQVVSSGRWHIITRSLGFPGDFVRHLKYYFVGMYFNLFLPTGVGGDLLKVIYLTKDSPKRLKATYTILLDRSSGLWAMYILGGLATLFLATPLPHYMDMTLKGIAIGVIAFLFLHRPIYHLLNPHLKGRLARFDTPLILLDDTPTLLKAFFLSLIIQALGMGSIYVLGRGMDLPVEWGYYFSMFPLVALAILLPISFNGIGVREGGFIYFLGLRGVPQEKALTLSLGFFSIQVISSLLGGIIYGLGLHRR